MTRNSSKILPFCKECGEYKGLGPCRNPECKANNSLKTKILDKRKNKCIICGEIAANYCRRCGLGYCTSHSRDMDETRLINLEQHLGTCTICGEVVCEQCWIFNYSGLVTCQIHNSFQKTTGQ